MNIPAHSRPELSDDTPSVEYAPIPSHYPPVSEIQKEQMDRNLQFLGQLMEGSNVRWNMDGAINISMLRGTYIRQHKDLDISVLSSDVPAFINHLENRGFSLFALVSPNDVPNKSDSFDSPHWGAQHIPTIHDDGDAPDNMITNDERKLVKISQKNIGLIKGHETLAIRIDEAGVPQYDALDVTSSLDVHIPQQHPDGSVEIRPNVFLPEQDYQTVTRSFHGVTLEVSDPALVLFHKLHEARPFDSYDLEYLQGIIKWEDLIKIRQLLEQESNLSIAQATAFCEEIWKSIQEFDLRDKEKIMKTLSEHPLIAAHQDDERISPWIQSSAEFLAATAATMRHPDLEEIRLRFVQFGVREMNPGSEVQERLDRLRLFAISPGTLQ